MNTADLLVTYHKLEKTNPKQAELFLQAHQSNKRFVSLVALKHEFLTQFRKILIEQTRKH